jgi:hypothetical protein
MDQILEHRNRVDADPSREKDGGSGIHPGLVVVLFATLILLENRP